MIWHPSFLTHNTSEWTGWNAPSPSDDAVSSLSDILETGDVPQRFYLSAKACRGILRRAGKRGKELPRLLQSALENIAKGSAHCAQQEENATAEAKRSSHPPEM